MSEAAPVSTGTLKLANPGVPGLQRSLSELVGAYGYARVCKALARTRRAGRPKKNELVYRIAVGEEVADFIVGKGKMPTATGISRRISRLRAQKEQTVRSKIRRFWHESFLLGVVFIIDRHWALLSIAQRRKLLLKVSERNDLPKALANDVRVTLSGPGHWLEDRPLPQGLGRAFPSPRYSTAVEYILRGLLGHLFPEGFVISPGEGQK